MSGGQVARDDVRIFRLCYQWTEVPAATQIGRKIDLFGRGKIWASQVWIRRELCRGAGAVTPVAIGLYIDDVAAQSHQGSILMVEIELYRSGVKASLHPALPFAVVFALCLCRRFAHQAERESYPGS